MSDIDKTVLLKEKVKMISTLRGLVKVLGVCDLCGDEEKVSIQENILRITFNQRDKVECDLQLCNLHEGVLLQKLLKPYLKRMECSLKRREKKLGFKEEIPLLLPGEIEEDAEIPSLIEKKHSKEPPSWDVSLS